MQMIISK